MRLLLLAAFVGFAFAETQSYRGYKVLRFTPSESELLQLKQFEDAPGFDFWNDPHQPGDNLDVMVAPEQQPEFMDYLASNKIDFQLLFDDMQEFIDSEKEYARKVTAQNRNTRGITFNKYYTHSEINSYLRELASSYPSVASVSSIGRSSAGRDLLMIKISSGGSNKPAILIDAGIHAREWIAPAMALYIIQQLVENSANRDLISNVDWYIIPVLNPDGYEYSHTSTRLWRKTRSATSSSSCPGVDGNRNFEFHWMETGASSSPCSETFAGSRAFSEPETRAIRDFALANRNQIKLYLTFHSYGNYFLYPWGYTSALPSDSSTLRSLAQQANAAHVAAGGSSYTIGSSTNVLYAAAGGSDDYMKGVAGINLSYTLEFTNTMYGFQLPASQIQTTVTRFFPAIRVFGNYIKNNF